MGFGFLFLLISLLPLSKAKDLRHPAASAVDRRSAPDALLGEIFNDPSATSLTKLNLEDSDTNNNDLSGSGSELWSGSGDSPKPSEDSSSQSVTLTANKPPLQQTSTQTETTGSENLDKVITNNSTDSKESNNTVSVKSGEDTATNSTSRTDTDSTKDDTSPTPDITNSDITSTAAHNVPLQSSTNSSSVITQSADTKLPSTEDQSQNSVVQTGESSKSSNDTSASKVDFYPAQFQNSLETFPGSPAADFVGQQEPGFDDSALYDPTIVKKNNLPANTDLLLNPVDDSNKEYFPEDVRSAIPQAPMLSPQAPAVRKSAVAQVPFKGSFPLQLHKYSPYAKLLKKGLVPKPGPGKDQQSAKKSVVPEFSEAGGLRPLSVNLPEQQQPDSKNPQGYVQPQTSALSSDQVPYADQAAAGTMAPTKEQSFAPVPAASQSQVYAQAPEQNPQQALDQVQGGGLQATEQPFYPQEAAPSNMQAPGFQNTTAAFPMNASMNNELYQQVGIPPQGAQVVPVYQGLKPKKPVIENDECEDQFDTCPEMSKNEYCKKYPSLMKIQCKKSCGFCEIKKHDEASGSGEYEESGSATRLYYADEVSGSGSSDHAEDDDDSYDDDPEYKKSGIPQPLHKVLMSKFGGASGSGSGDFEFEESSTSGDDISQTSGSGNEGSGSQKKDDIKATVAGSGSGETPSSVPSPTVGGASNEIGSGSASLAEDLATGTVSRANEKHSSIPRPIVPVQQVSLYPKIDLKEIAKAVNVYRGVALKMLGEALEGAAEEKQEELSKKSHIPLPPATNILQRMGFPIGYDEGSKRNMIPNAMPALNPMAPNYGMLGYGGNGYAYNYPQPVPNEPLANFYSQYQQGPNVARSDIFGATQDEPQSEEGAAQDEQPEEIQPVTLPAENATKQEKKEDKEDKPEAPQNKTTSKDSKKSEIVDPYEYVRNMGKGASMEPIRSKTASDFQSTGHSDPLILWKNSQSTKLMTLAKKKSSIPQPDPGMPVFTETESPQATEQQQFRSEIPQENTSSDVPDISGQALQQSAPVFPQYTPQSDNFMQIPMDDVAARSQITQNFGSQQQQQQEINRNSVPSASAVDFFASQTANGPAVNDAFSDNPIPQPVGLAKQGVSRSELTPVMNTVNSLSAAGSQSNLVVSQPTDSVAIGNPVPQPDALGKPGFYRSELTKANSTLEPSSSETPADAIDEALTSPSILSQDQHSAEPLTASLNSKITSSLDNKEDSSSQDIFETPEAQISGKIPSTDNMDFGVANIGANRAKVSDNDGDALSDEVTDNGLAKAKIPGKTLPPLNHGMETVGVLPPLNHNMESTSSLPQLNYAKEEAANLPPLLHGIEQAGNLPPLNHGNDALQSFNSLPPLHHGTEQAANLPPLFHGIEANKLPPLNHANEQAGILPPLLQGVEQSQGVPSLSDFEKGSSPTDDALSAFTSQANDALKDNGKQPNEHMPVYLNGVEKDSIEIPKDIKALEGNSNATAGEGNKQAFGNDEGNFLKNLNDMQPIFQGEESSDRPSFVQKDERVEAESGMQDTSYPDTDDSIPKGSVPTPNDNEEELQKLLNADRMFQRVITAEKGFGNQAFSGPPKDPLANFLRIWQKTPQAQASSRLQDSTTNGLVSSSLLSSGSSPGYDRYMPPGNNGPAKPDKVDKYFSSDDNNKASVKQEIAKEKSLIVDSLGKLKIGLEEALQETRGIVPTPPTVNNLDVNQRFQVQVPNVSPIGYGPSNDQMTGYMGPNSLASSWKSFDADRRFQVQVPITRPPSVDVTGYKGTVPNIGLYSPIPSPWNGYDANRRFQVHFPNTNLSNVQMNNVKGPAPNNGLNSPALAFGNNNGGSQSFQPQVPNTNPLNAQMAGFGAYPKNGSTSPTHIVDANQRFGAQHPSTAPLQINAPNSYKEPSYLTSAARNDYFDNQRLQAFNTTSTNVQMMLLKSVYPSNRPYNPTISTDDNAANFNPLSTSNSSTLVTSGYKVPSLGNNQMGNNYNSGPRRPYTQSSSYLSNININQPNVDDEFQRVAPNPIANELAANTNLQTQSLRFNQVKNKPLNMNLGLNAVDFQRRNNSVFDDSSPPSTQTPYNSDMPLANQPSVNPYLNIGETVQSYVGKPPLTPPLEHAYPMSHQHAALLPPLNNQPLPPLNHNKLIAAADTNRYTGSEANTFASQGTTRSQFNAAPPIYPFTIPPEGEQESQGYHSEQGGDGYNEIASQASTRGSLASPQFYPSSQSAKQEPALARQFFPQGGQPYPIPLPPEGSQSDPLNTGHPTIIQQQQPQLQDTSLLEDPSPYQPVAWKKGNRTQGKPCGQGDKFCPYPFYPVPLPPEGEQNDQNEPAATQAQSPNSNIGKKNLIRPKPDLQCGAGWKGALGDFGSFCYKEVFERKTWDNAHSTCKNLGGELFSVTNAYEQRFLENFTNIESWLGYRDKSRDGTWSWSDSSLSVFTNWDSSTKNDNGKGRDCVVLNAEEGKWKDAPCKETKEYLCKKRVDDCTKGWKKLTLNSVQGCYKLFKEKKAWEHALVSCMDKKASLASILSDDEQTMISQVYSKSNFWIGYNDIDNEGDWVWTDRATSSYTNWDDKSPNNGGVSCAIVTTNGRWHDEPCQSQYGFICKKPSPKGLHHPLNDATLTHEVQKFVSNKSLLNPDIDTSVTIFGRHSVTPQYLWTVQKISNSRIHGSNPIAVHGKVKAVDGGLQLNGVDAWLDAGDFYGQCLGDPDLCIKGFSFALQLNFDDDALSYTDERLILDSSGDSRGVAVFIQHGSLYYKVTTSTREWQLSTELVTNQWQDIVMTWKKEEGLMLYVNGAFRDSLKEGRETSFVPNKQARLTIGRKSGNPPFKYTRMYISSLFAFTRFLAPEDVPYVFTFDNTVVPRYMWLLPKLQDKKINGSPDIEVYGSVKAVDGGVHLDGKESYLKVGSFNQRCLHDPSNCPDGLSLSCKLKFNRVVRSYKEPHYILDSGGHVKGTRGLSAYLLNNNLYFSVAMSTDEDTLTWTVRTSIFTVRWQRVVLSWSLSDGLWLYTDSQFRGWTKTPKSVPRDVMEESGEFIVGRKNVGSDVSPAEFSIGSLAVFPRFLEKKDVEKVFSGKKMPYPGVIREVWKELPGKSISKLKDDPYYPNDPSLIEIIENFDAPFDIDKDYGSRVKGYFVAPETGNYTFYMSGSQSGELWMSSTERQQNLTKLVSMDQPTGHNQWNKYAGQSSRSVNLEAGKYYYTIGVQKGSESTDSFSAGVRLPSGRFMRPITKEILQWRMPGDPFAGVIREVWQDIPGYRIMDLTSNPNFPNNPSSIEVLDKFDAPHNVDDNYGSRIRGFFKAPESGLYRFFLAADTTGELWLSSDETEKNLKKVVAINGWTAHNEWLKFPEQKSDRIHLRKGKYYYIEAYQKSDKLADCVSVAVELPSGHFEGPIKRVHLSWRLPDGRTGPGPSSEEEAIPKPVGLYPLNKGFGAKDAGPNGENGVTSNVDFATGPDDDLDGAYKFKGVADSFVEIPNDGKMDTKNSMTILANIYPTGSGGPILNYKTDGWGVHLWQFESTELFVRFVHRNGVFHKPIASRVLQLNEWNQVGATYDNNTGVAQLWHNGKMVKSRNIGQIQLATQYPIRIGARDGDDRRFSGKISCLQIYDKALDEQQIGSLKSCPVKAPLSLEDDLESGLGSGSGDWDEQDRDSTAVLFSHNAGKYDKDEEADDEIQGSESNSGNKCDPKPCENGGKCIRDSRRLDGYRCKCTSDFTGRNCQVSKPDAENPIVKKAKIPKPELKIDSESYQKNSSNLDVIAENIPDEKKQDVLLLFQKVGCYKDEILKHDLPDQATVKSVTQEDCVRSCAMEEKGYSYFGLQNADVCYCGHRYGRYGKADEALCNMPCKGNDKENCGGNSTNMVYFFGLGTNYTVSTLTGDMDGADTNANVYVTLYGEKGDSGFRKLETKHFGKGKNDTSTLILPDLGKLRQVRILHDNSGTTPSWFLQKLTVTDENGRKYEFPCKEWLSETQGGGKTERLLRLQHT
ncbi:uncharacterized protein LOC141874734 isoform X6 [Acropora palmata]|uniref:uncharacterized protein LOC141874734 isoform X6 n=1 Tax=Acropora palmata TaxID=6131 RepID=UPI003DA11ABC